MPRMRSTRAPVIGLDIGGVLVDRRTEGSAESLLGSRPMSAPVVEGAFDGVRYLVELFEGRVFLCSKAGRRTARVSMDWLERHGFLRVVRREAVRFVLARHEKALVAAEFGATHFVDDTSSVVEALEGTVPNRYLLTAGLTSGPGEAPRGARLVQTWPVLLSAVEATI